MKPADPWKIGDYEGALLSAVVGAGLVFLTGLVWPIPDEMLDAAAFLCVALFCIRNAEATTRIERAAKFETAELKQRVRALRLIELGLFDGRVVKVTVERDEGIEDAEVIE